MFSLTPWQFYPREYIVGLLAQSFLSKYESASIIHDPRVIWNTLDIVKLTEVEQWHQRQVMPLLKAQCVEDAVYGGKYQLTTTSRLLFL